MKRHVSILILLVILLLLCAVNSLQAKEKVSTLQKQPEWLVKVLKSEEQRQISYKHPDFRFRNWRMTESLKQDDYQLTGNPVNDSKNIYFYNHNFPGRIDSIRIYNWDEVTGEWKYFLSDKYFYDQTGEYLNSVLITDYDINKTIFKHERDTQNRLTSIKAYFFYPEGDSVMYCSYDYTYNNDRLVHTDVYSLWWNPDAFYTYESRINNLDTQGRITDILFYGSEDSVNFSMDRQVGVTYHPDDTTTGQQYIQNLSHLFMNCNFWQIQNYGMVNTITTFSNEVQGNWSVVRRRIFDYESFNINNITYQDNNNLNWYNYSQIQYVYNENALPVQMLTCIWNVLANDWTIPYRIVNYTWEQYTSNAEENIVHPARLISVYPNPFRDVLTIEMNNDKEMHTRVSIYNCKGQLVRTLDKAIAKSITWDGKDNDGKYCSEGLYLIKVESPTWQEIRKAVKLK